MLIFSYTVMTEVNRQYRLLKIPPLHSKKGETPTSQLTWIVYLHSARVFHNLIVLSRLPETICRLSTEKATLKTSCKDHRKWKNWFSIDAILHNTIMRKNLLEYKTVIKTNEVRYPKINIIRRMRRPNSKFYY